MPNSVDHLFAPRLLCTVDGLTHIMFQMRHRKGITLSDDARNMAVSSLVRHVNTLIDDPISELQGTLLLDHILAEIAPSIYNQAIAEARQYITERAEELDTVLHHAEFPTEPTRRKRG